MTDDPVRSAADEANTVRTARLAGVKDDIRPATEREMGLDELTLIRHELTEIRRLLEKIAAK